MPLRYWSSKWHAQWELIPVLAAAAQWLLIRRKITCCKSFAPGRHGRCGALLTCCFIIIISWFVSTAVRRPVPKIPAASIVSYYFPPNFLSSSHYWILGFPLFCLPSFGRHSVNKSMVHLLSVVHVTWPAKPHFFILLACRAIYLREAMHDISETK